MSDADRDRGYWESTLRALFAGQRLAVLATDDGDSPYTSLVAFFAADDLGRLLFATARSTRKYTNIAGNSNVSLLVDNRANAPADFRDAIAVTALGRAAEVSERERERLLPGYLAKHPHLAEFVGAPSCALMRVSVLRYLIVSRFQDVTELRMAP
ncbi:MAG: pyridoxamine 5'-phosphate oxidase family protein [Desulfococcaceae bacterium]